MTYQDKLTACKRRMAGYSWEEIGQELGYAGSTVQKTVLNAMQFGRKSKRIKYPFFRDLITTDYNSSIFEFANAIEDTFTFYQRILNILTGRSDPKKADIDRLVKFTGKPYDVIFSLEEPSHDDL